MKKSKKILLIAIFIIVISNLPPVYYFIGENYHYQNYDGSFSFTEQPGTGQNFTVAKAMFKDFIRDKKQIKQDVLFRTFTIKPWKFWEWWQMVNGFDRFKLAYMTTRQNK
ncbi:hypothetical protein [Pedobacter sp.]|uniref:hypothetical protein n=1 Tax=Pedobacter sp. TaxID=1411316 RepID=UPI003BAB52E5